MIITCPSCKYSAEAINAKIPATGANTRCPRCKTVFLVTPETPASPSDSQTITCPKCGAVQEPAEICGCCGIIIEKYQATELRRQMAGGTKEAATVYESEPLSAGLGSFNFGNGRGEIISWAEAGLLATDGLPQAFRIAGILPGPHDWRRFLDLLTLWMGAAFLAAAVIFFFAYNWKELGHFARFGIVELLLASAVLAAWRLGLERMSGKAALMVATMLVGALLALVGQTYQTGADPWELFAAWALFALPWAAIACFSPLWLFWLALLNLSISLYYHAFAGFFGILFRIETVGWVLMGINTVALAVWEFAGHRGVTWLAERWAPRIVATAGLGFMTLLAAWGIVQPKQSGFTEFVAYSAWLGGAYAIYRHQIKDLYMLALGVLSIIVIITVFLSHNLMRHADPGTFLFIGMTVLGLSAGGGWWLRSVATEVPE